MVDFHKDIRSFRRAGEANMDSKAVAEEVVVVEKGKTEEEK